MITVQRQPSEPTPVWSESFKWSLIVKVGRNLAWLESGFRSPNLSERYFQGSDGELSWQMNEGLQSQSSNTFEIGSRRKSPRWTYSWSLYHSQVLGSWIHGGDTVSVPTTECAPLARFSGIDASVLLLHENFSSHPSSQLDSG